MARQRKEKKAKDIKLRQPDRSAPTDKTLLQIAEERNLFNMADQQQLKNNKTKVAVGEQKEGRQMKAEGGEEEGDSDNVLPPSADRFMETILYAVCLAMLHFTLDYLVQHQYAMEIEMHKIITRAIQALVVFAALVHALHPHAANTTFIPGLPARFHHAVRQAIFFVTSLASGCYLILITNKYTYMAVLKQAPPVGCLWVWSVLEMDLAPSVLSLVGAYLYFWHKGYKF